MKPENPNPILNPYEQELNSKGVEFLGSVVKNEYSLNHDLLTPDIFGPEQETTILASLENLSSYMGQSIIKDNFDGDHQARREWRKKMTEKFGDDFRKSIVDPNALRITNISTVLGAMERLCGASAGSGMHVKLERIRYRCTDCLEGKSNRGLKIAYQDATTTDKIQRVKYLGRQCATVISLFSRPEIKQKKSLATARNLHTA